MEKLKRERVQLRRLFSKDSKEMLLKLRESENKDELKPCYKILKDKAMRLFELDNRIKDIWLESEDFDEADFENDFSVTENFRNDWITIDILYEESLKETRNHLNAQNEHQSGPLIVTIKEEDIAETINKPQKQLNSLSKKGKNKKQGNTSQLNHSYTSRISSAAQGPLPVSQHTCSTSKDSSVETLKNFMETVSERLKVIDQKVDMILTNQCTNPSLVTREDDDILGALPLATLDEFMHFEDQLRKNFGLQQKLVKIFVRIGGKEAQTHVSNMMYHLFDNKLAIQFTLTGKSEDKMPFLGTKICKLIFEAAFQAHKTTGDTIKEAIETWLQQAKVQKFRRIIYKIVEFASDRSCEVVPTTWVHEKNLCLWPTESLQKGELASAIKWLTSPKPGWKAHTVTILGEAATYKEAQNILKEARSVSIFMTGSKKSGHLKKRKKSRGFDASSDNETFLKRSRLHSSDEDESVSIEITEDLLSTPHMQQFLSNSESNSFTSNKPNSPSQDTENLTAQLLACTPTIDGNENTPDTLQSVFQELNLVRRTQAHQLKMAMEMLTKVTPSSITPSTMLKDETIQLEREFPLRCAEDLEDLERDLKNIYYKKDLVSKIKMFGGTSYADYTRRVMRFFFTDDFAQTYTWYGMHSKKKFSSTRLCNLIVDAIMDSTDTSRIQVEGVIKNWLRHAKERSLYHLKAK